MTTMVMNPMSGVFAGQGDTQGRAKRFAADCRDLGITVHGTFIIGLPGETKETIQETVQFAREVNPHSIQVSVAAPYPGTELYRQAKENGWLPEDEDGATLVIGALTTHYQIESSALLKSKCPLLP